MKLTNKEASEWLIAIKRDYIYGGDEDYDKRRKLALDMGAEALENQKTLQAELESIKAEIIKGKCKYCDIDSNIQKCLEEHNSLCDVDDILVIIDNHIKELNK